jgi:hypothetical protein
LQNRDSTFRVLYRDELREKAPAVLEVGASERAKSEFTARCPEEQQETIWACFKGVAGKIDAPARAGILASFEPEGEAFVTFVTPE